MQSKKVPILMPYVKLKKEYHEGYLFNPYAINSLKINWIGIKISEMCNGGYTLEEIILNIGRIFRIPEERTKEIVNSAFGLIACVSLLTTSASSLKTKYPKRKKIAKVANSINLFLIKMPNISI